VQATLREATRAEWMARFGDEDVCVEPVLRLEESEVD
jgi:crotonobetainyl-CoA:carnitine CoA-transferase CaiB-like acyl-CoA transferase